MHVAIVRQPLLLVVDLVFTAAWFAWHIQHCERNAVKTFKQLASSQDWTASMVDYGVLAVHWCTWQTNGHRTFFAVSVGSIELLRCTVSNKTCIALRTNEVSLHQCALHPVCRTVGLVKCTAHFSQSELVSVCCSVLWTRTTMRISLMTAVQI